MDTPTPYQTIERKDSEIDSFFVLDPTRVQELKQITASIYPEEQPYWYFIEVVGSSYDRGISVSKVVKLE